MHFYSAEGDANSNSDLADMLVATAAEVYTAAEGLVAKVALAGSEQPVHSGPVATPDRNPGPRRVVWMG